MNTTTNDRLNAVTELTGTLPADERYREGFFKKNLNKLLAWFLYLVSLLPFSILYLISDFFYIMIRYVFHYRINIVKENLDYAFPEKTEKEKKQIIQKFYRHFTDLMMETVKLHSISEKEIYNRIQYEGLELINSYYNKGMGIIIFAMHHNNWEWCSSMMAKVKHRGFMIYNPIRGNQAMEKFLLHSREKWGGKCIPVHMSARVALGFHQNKIPAGVWLGADQTPPATSKFWTVFLNREAPFFSGPEKIAAKTNQPVFFQHMTKVGRGRYIARFELLIENPAAMVQKEILLRYVAKMEEIIRQEPEYYLWSHRRWKHTRPEGIPLSTF
jgi:Kdo2-lipid IVA lauroyltransferase/acyltransferase